MRSETTLIINRLFTLVVIIALAAGCSYSNKNSKRVPVAKAGEAILYLDEIPALVNTGTTEPDSSVIVQDYINKWARTQLMFQQAEENLTPEMKIEIDNQVEETRSDLTIYQYQRQMMLEKMDTLISDVEMENFYITHSQNFILGSSIVKALFIKVPFETPNMYRIRMLARSNEPKDLQELETICYQFAEKFDDFDEKWVTLDRISIELPQEINNEVNFLKRTTFYESTDSVDIYLLKLRDYKLKSTPAPFDYVIEDIKRIIWNTRRLEFIQNLEKGIYNKAIEENKFIIYNN
jgi:hypothetical protein